MPRVQRSVWWAWGGLLAIDLVGRAHYLAPRLITARGALNYFVAAIVLWMVVRLLAVLPLRVRVPVFALVVALPMAVQWAMFRTYGAFVEPADFILFVDSPRVVFTASQSGVGGFGAALVFVLALACAWLVPKARQPLGWRIAPATVFLVASLAAGATYWRASPSLEHGVTAFACSFAGLLHRQSVLSHAGKHVTVPAMAQTGERPNVIVVVGESLVASHLSFYGYDRATSPRLQALFDRGDLVAFRDATVMGPNTRTSVPYILTGLEGPDPTGRVFGAPTLLEYAKARGYHTAFLSAQEESWGDLDVLFHEGVDSFRTGLQFAPEVDVMDGADDLTVLEEGVLPALHTIAEPFFVVLHMNGSHAPYRHHRRASAKIFDDSEGVNSVNAYDNTVHETDEYLARTLEALRSRDPNAWMFFTSDHGQSLGEGGVFFNRGYQSNIVRDPLLVFPPHGDEHARWSELAIAPAAACDIAPTVVHLIGATPAVPMDCTDWFATAPRDRLRVVSAYTPAGVREPTMLLLMPDGTRAMYDLGRGTVITDDGATRSVSDFGVPASIEARLH